MFFFFPLQIANDIYTYINEICKIVSNFLLKEQNLIIKLNVQLFIFVQEIVVMYTK